MPPLARVKMAATKQGQQGDQKGGRRSTDKKGD